MKTFHLRTMRVHVVTGLSRCRSLAACCSQHAVELVRSFRHALLLQVSNTISIWNNGDGVPVEMHKEEGVYVPELIFGHLLTSSNYDDEEKKATFL